MNFRLKTREVKIGKLLLGNGHPIRIQTMTTTDTMDTQATVEQSIRCIQAGAELLRITAPSKNEAENLQIIKEELHKRGSSTPLVADIHFTPNAAEIAAKIIEKVRVNPGNYVDKKKFEQIDYTDAEYAEEIERIKERFTPLVLICAAYGTAMRIGTNHGSLSDRIMSRYGDTAIGMVESAMEFLRIARNEDYHNIVLSMKSSNPIVMVEAYRLLVKHMQDEFGECYPLHLGVTEAGDGEDGRIKSAIGIGTLLQEGIGDTIRISLTPEPGGDRTREVIVGQEILQTMGLRAFTPMVIACPGCGRTSSTVFQELADRIQTYLREQMPIWKGKYPGVESMNVAVMGCVVNGPGESRHADIGISLPGTGEVPAAPVFVDGERTVTLKGDHIAEEFQVIVQEYVTRRYGAARVATSTH